MDVGSGSAPKCTVCFHYHEPGEKCSICGHTGKMQVIPKYMSRLKQLCQLKFFSATIDEFDTYSTTIVGSIGHEVLEKEFGIPNASFNVFGLDPWTCYYSFTPAATRTYALVGAAAMLSAAHSIIVESAASPISSVSLSTAISGMDALGGGLVPQASLPTGSPPRVIVLIQSLAISKAYRGRRCTIEFLQYVVTDAISHFPDTTIIFLCTYCNKQSPAYSSLLSKSFIEDPHPHLYPPVITNPSGTQYVAMIANVGNLFKWLNISL